MVTHPRHQLLSGLQIALELITISGLLPSLWLAYNGQLAKVGRRQRAVVFAPENYINNSFHQLSDT